MANNVAGEISMDLNVNTDKAEKSLDSYANKLSTLMARVSKVQDTTKNTQLKKALEEVARQMLMAGRATTGLQLLPEMRTFLPKGKKLSTAQVDFIRSSLSAAQSWNQNRKKAESFAERMAISAAKTEMRAKEHEENEISKAKERTSLSAEYGARKEEKYQREKIANDIAAIDTQEKNLIDENIYEQKQAEEDKKRQKARVRIASQQRAWEAKERQKKVEDYTSWWKETFDRKDNVKTIVDMANRAAFYKRATGKTDKDYLSHIDKTINSLDKTTKKQYAYEIYNARKTAGLSTGSAAGASGIGAALKTLGPIVSFGLAARKLAGWVVTKLMSGFKEGQEAFVQHSIYDRSSLDLGLSRAVEAGWGISREAANAPQQYAADFRQRMMWGEVSDKEIIGLSRMGRYGHMVMSGAAGKDPRAAWAELKNFVQNNDKATVRSAFRQVGLPLDLMQAMQGIRTPEEEEELYNTFKRVTDLEESSAMSTYRVKAALKEGEALIESMSGQIAKGYRTLSPSEKMRQREEFSRRGWTDQELDKYFPVDHTESRLSNIKKGVGFASSALGISSKIAESIVDIASVVINVNGAKDAKETADEVLAAMSNPIKQQIVNNQTTSIGR